jgi:hypothetical protein
LPDIAAAPSPFHLPVLRAIREGLMAPFRQPMTLGVIGLPLLLLHALAVYFDNRRPIDPDGFPLPSGRIELLSDTDYLALLAIPVLLVLLALSAAACLRRFHAIPDRPSRLSPAQWLACGFRLVGWTVAIAALGWLVSMPVLMLLAVVAIAPAQGASHLATGVLGLVSVFLAYAGAAYVVARSSLVAPATVQGRKHGFTDGWSMSRGNGLRLALTLFCLPTVGEVLNGIGALAGWSHGTHLALLAVAVYLSTASLAVLAFCYRQLLAVRTNASRKPDTAMEPAGQDPAMTA